MVVRVWELKIVGVFGVIFGGVGEFEGWVGVG